MVIVARFDKSHLIYWTPSVNRDVMTDTVQFSPPQTPPSAIDRDRHKSTVPADKAPKVVSMGCRLNLAEGASIERAAKSARLQNTVVINSCAVTNEAVRRTRQNVRRAKNDHPDATVVVTGCAAQIDPKMFSEMNEVDVVLGNHEKLAPSVWHDLARRQKQKSVTSNETSVLVNDIMSVRETAGHLVEGYGDRARAFLQIQNGCDHRCTFCIIPFGRGPSRSAPVDDVIAQARKLIQHGHQELVLTGVDITSWGDDLEGSPRLGHLVERLLAEVDGLFRLRLSSIDGAEIDPLLTEIIQTEERLAPHIHLSVQAGDNLILKRMKRRHTREDVISLCNRLRANRPEIAFGADIIAGFPTETQAMFENSRALIKDAGLNYLHVFPFSPRSGAPAARMPQVQGTEIKKRAERLRTDGQAATIEFLDALIGSTATGVAESGGRVRLGNFAQVKCDAHKSSFTESATAKHRNGNSSKETKSQPAAIEDRVTLRVTGRQGLILTGHRV